MHEHGLSQPLSKPRGLLIVGAAALLLSLAAFAGYQHIFSTYADYDDEGYVMLSLVSYMQGEPLYDATYTQYGPAFFALQSAFHRVTGLPITHDVTRLKTLFLWLLVAAMCGMTIRRMTDSRIAALAGGLAVFLHLDRLCLEPGHPQEFCVLAIAAVVLLGTRLSPGKPSYWPCAGMGVVVGVTLMTKLNVGVFLLAAITLTLLILGPRDRWTTLVSRTAVSAAIALPFVLAWGRLRTDIALPVIVAFATFSIVRVASSHRDAPSLSWRHMTSFVLSCGVTAGLFGWLALANGTSLGGLYYGLIGQHQGFSVAFFTPAPLHVAVVVWALCATAAAINSRLRHRSIDAIRLVMVGAFFYTCVRYMLETFVPLIHGLNDRGAAGALLGIAGPTLWVLLLPTNGTVGRSSTASVAAPRLLLCLVAALQPLGAFPTPGTQMAVGTIALVIGCVVALRDGVWLDGAWLLPGRMATVGVMVFLVGTLLLRDVQLHQRRSSLTPLDLPGATRLYMENERVEQKRWLAHTLRERSDTFVFAEHGQNSLYFWTGLQPPTALNTTFWPFLLNAAEQRRVISALERSERVAVVHAVGRRELPADSPLLQHLAEHYRPAYSKGQFQVWLKTPALP